MIRIVASAALVLLSTVPSFAQSYCDQVRQGIAQYGYAAARRYAVEHYSPREVRAADRCVVTMRRRHFSRLRSGSGYLR
jgi:alanine racemase